MVYLSIYCEFKDDEARQKWAKENVIGQTIPQGGCVFAYSQNDESCYRDINNGLIKAIEYIFASGQPLLTKLTIHRLQSALKAAKKES